jgi:hypothetical protein
VRRALRRKQNRLELPGAARKRNAPSSLVHFSN